VAIDWAGEPFARLFKRETDDDLLLSWEARAVWHEFLKKCDRNGVLETKRGVRGFAALIRIPVDVVERVLGELLEDGRLRSIPGLGFVAPNYKTANYTPRSGRARMADARIRSQGGRSDSDGTTGVETRDAHLESEAGQRLESEMDGPDCVTEGDERLRDVTQGDAACPYQIRADQDRAPSARTRAGGARSPIPPDWTPSEAERALAIELGLDVVMEADEFRSYWLGDGRKKLDWDQAFAARLKAQARQRSRRSAGEPPRDIPEL
jgi:hypothetical protein